MIWIIIWTSNNVHSFPWDVIIHSFNYGISRLWSMGMAEYLHLIKNYGCNHLSITKAQCWLANLCKTGLWENKYALKIIMWIQLKRSVTRLWGFDTIVFVHALSCEAWSWEITMISICVHIFCGNQGSRWKLTTWWRPAGGDLKCHHCFIVRLNLIHIYPVPNKLKTQLCHTIRCC